MKPKRTKYKSVNTGLVRTNTAQSIYNGLIETIEILSGKRTGKPISHLLKKK